jgi:hypothetical protein
MRRFVAPFASVIVVSVLVGWASVFAQTTKLVVAQGSDGTLYVVTDRGRFTLVPVAISDDEVNASVDLGALDGSQILGAAPVAAAPPAPPAPTEAPIAPAATPVPPTPVPVKPIALNGKGTLNTQAFHLSAGNYNVNWKAHVDEVFGSYGASLKPVTPNSRFFSGSLGSSGFLKQGQSADGQTVVYNVPEGDYYVDASSPGATWTITLEHQ